MSVPDIKDSIDRVLDLRKKALQKLFRLQHISLENSMQQVQQICHICMLASSSRGGSSVTAELLQWQGADCAAPAGRLLTLPGEEKPHLILSGLAYPARNEKFDDLTDADARTGQASILQEELRSEIGYPIAFCTDLELYSIQLYRRLLLQWPLLISTLDPDEAIMRIKLELEVVFPKGYHDSQDHRRLALAACVRCFPFIKADFYDCWPVHIDSEVTTMAQKPWSFEETPFVFPPPWHNANSVDMDNGILLLRDPSNAWRMLFWRRLFEKQEIRILHLVRDPRESVQGLCDGWNYPFGFQTITNSHDIVIPGYTNERDIENDLWKKRRLNFSICKRLSKKIFDDKAPLTLAEICAFQWNDAHQQILEDSARLGIARTVINFSDLRLNTATTFRKICFSFQLESSRSGLKYVDSFSDRWVMATPNAKDNWHNRWLTSSFSEEIKELYASGYFELVTETLGLFKPTKVKGVLHA